MESSTGECSARGTIAGKSGQGGKAAIVEEEVVVAWLGIDELPYLGSTNDGGEGEPTIEASSLAKAWLRMTTVEGDSVVGALVAKALLREPAAGDDKREGAGQLLL